MLGTFFPAHPLRSNKLANSNRRHICLLPLRFRCDSGVPGPRRSLRGLGWDSAAITAIPAISYFLVTLNVKFTALARLPRFTRKKFALIDVISRRKLLAVVFPSVVMADPSD